MVEGVARGAFSLASIGDLSRTPQDEVCSCGLHERRARLCERTHGYESRMVSWEPRAELRRLKTACSIRCTEAVR